MVLRNVMILILALAAPVAPALAQADATPRPSVDPARLAQARTTSVGLITGGFGSTEAQAAAEVADVLDSGEPLRVLPILGIGSVQNIEDLINLKGVDLAIVHADALTRASQLGAIPQVPLVRYIAKLFNDEVHVLARKDMTSLNDLVGKSVNVGPPGSGTEITAGVILDTLHIAANLDHGSQSVALDRLRRGELAAVFVVDGQPVPQLRDIDLGPGTHFLPVPLTTQFLDTYVPTKLDPLNYPKLIPAGKPIDTVAVGTLLLTVSKFPDAARAKQVNRFVDLFFDRFDQLRQPGHHPKWQEVNLNAQVAGFTRLPEAQSLAAKLEQAKPDLATPERTNPGQLGLGQAKNSPPGLRSEFDAYLQQLGQASTTMSDGQKDALFQDFLRWRDRQRGP